MSLFWLVQCACRKKKCCQKKKNSHNLQKQKGGQVWVLTFSSISTSSALTVSSEGLIRKCKRPNTISRWLKWPLTFRLGGLCHRLGLDFTELSTTIIQGSLEGNALIVLGAQIRLTMHNDLKTRRRIIITIVYEKFWWSKIGANLFRGGACVFRFELASVPVCIRESTRIVRKQLINQVAYLGTRVNLTTRVVNTAIAIAPTPTYARSRVYLAEGGGGGKRTKFRWRIFAAK